MEKSADLQEYHKKAEKTLTKAFFNQIVIEKLLQLRDGIYRKKAMRMLDCLVILKFIEVENSFGIREAVLKFDDKMDTFEKGTWIPDKDYEEFTDEIISLLNKPELESELLEIAESKHPRKFRDRSIDKFFN